MSTKKSKKSTAMEGVFGPNLLSDNDTTVSTSAALKDKELVLLYFSASWCPPCKRFTPILSKFYTEHCIQHKIEIVFISSDSDLNSFQTYYETMPFKSIPPHNTASIKQAIANRLKIAGIPSLVALTVKDGHLVSYDARNEVMLIAGDKDENKKACEDLIASWKSKSKDAVPIEEAGLSSPSQGGILGKIFMTIMRNPMYIVGIMFMVKRFLEKLQELGEEDDDNHALPASAGTGEGTGAGIGTEGEF